MELPPVKLTRSIYLLLITAVFATQTWAGEIIHDAEYYILASQNGEQWATEDEEIDGVLAQMKEKFGQPPNIVYILWDDTAYGAVGFPGLQKNFGYETPHLNQMAAEGINFARMYSEPACTPTRAAFLTGRIPVRHGMGVVGMPHEFSGLRKEEVTIAEVLSKAGLVKVNNQTVCDLMFSPEDEEEVLTWFELLVTRCHILLSEHTSDWFTESYFEQLI